MSAPNTVLATLIGSRICHDLISPIGAINNGLELLEMSAELNGPEIDLIGESVGNASARIRFFRIAFGAAGDQMVGEPEVVSILRDLYQASRLEVQWIPTDPQPRAMVRLTFLALLCLETAMPYGGSISISEQDGQWTLIGTADKLNVSSEIWDLLDQAGDVTGLQPSHVQFALLPTIAEQEQRPLTFELSETRITLRL